MTECWTTALVLSRVPSSLTHHSELCRRDQKELQEPSTSLEDDPDKEIIRHTSIVAVEPLLLNM